ncbi:hemerythrin domain-containing protein [Castellaniella sp.]|uniref:hemerythrin domain-containing protein n=1 Tax=Castellaniella sp. TaxID=1955812 RepID=UPI003C75840C
MNIDKFKAQHVEILSEIKSLRELSLHGIESHSAEIAALLASMSRTISSHLATEDLVLYPVLREDKSAKIAAMSSAYQEEMKGIATAYIKFSRHWNQVTLAADPQKFRDEANIVLKMVHSRIVKENTQFYPAIESLPGA